MSIENPFQVPGNWYKGNLHTHTTASDGTYTAEAHIRGYREKGYHFLAITDHAVAVTDFERPASGDFLVLSGMEVDARDAESGRNYHFVVPEAKALAPRWSPLSEEMSPQEVLDAIREGGGLAILAHPYWSGLTLTDMLAVEGYIGLEVFNTVCERMTGRGSSGVHWDDLLEAGRTPMGFATDDAHCNRTYMSEVFQGWIMVKALCLEEESILESIRRGRFYSSSGPTIGNVEIEDGVVRVSSSPVVTINFICDHTLGKQICATYGDTLAEGEYALRGRETYVRVECIDWLGRTAWSNPFRLPSDDRP